MYGERLILFISPKAYVAKQAIEQEGNQMKITAGYH